MPYTAQFFAEKLNVPVEYFNPFRNVQIDPAVNLEELARVAHSLGEVGRVGPAQPRALPGGAEPHAGQHAALAEFQPEEAVSFIATVFSLVIMAFRVSGYLFEKLAAVKT